MTVKLKPDGHRVSIARMVNWSVQVSNGAFRFFNKNVANIAVSSTFFVVNYNTNRMTNFNHGPNTTLKPTLTLTLTPNQDVKPHLIQHNLIIL